MGWAACFIWFRAVGQGPWRQCLCALSSGAFLAGLVARVPHVCESVYARRAHLIGGARGRLYMGCHGLAVAQECWRDSGRFLMEKTTVSYVSLRSQPCTAMLFE